MDNAQSARTQLVRYFLVAIGYSWLFWLPPALTFFGIPALPIPNMVWIVLGVHGPLAASLWLTYQEGGWRAVKQLIRSGFNMRMGWGWWLAILFIPVVLAGLAVQTNVVLNGFQADRTLLGQPLMIMPTFLFMFFLGGSVQEEFGWRGYALPRLLKIWNPLVSSLVLGVIWGTWHLPLFFISGTSQSYMPFVIFFLLTPLFSLVFTWVYLRTGRNLFSALLLHTAVNTSMSLFPPYESVMGGNQLALTYLMVIYLVVSVLLVLLDSKLWKHMAA